MPGGGGGGGSQTVKNEPWGGAQPYLLDILKQAQTLYGSASATPFQSLSPEQRQQQAASMWGMTPGQVGQMMGIGGAPAGRYAGVMSGQARNNPEVQMSVRPGSVAAGGDIAGGLATGVMPLTADQIASQDRLRGIAGQPLSTLYGQAGSTVSGIAGNPLGTAGQQATSAANAVRSNPMGNYDTQARGIYNSVQSNAGGVYGDRAGSYLSDAAAGRYVGQQNPYLEGMYQAASRPVVESFNEQALPALSAQFSGAGRYGSGAQRAVQGQAAEDLQRTLGDMSSTLYGNAYSQERGLQQQAAGMLGNLGVSQDQLRQASAAGIAGIGQAQDQSRLAAGGLLGNLGEAGSRIGLSAAGMMPGIANAQTAAQLQQAGLLGQVGAQNQQIGQQVLGQLGGMYGGAQQAPWANLQNYADIVNANPAAGITNASTTGGGGFSGAGALGGGIMGGMGGSMLGGSAMMAPAMAAMGPWGVPLMIGGGALAGGVLGGMF